MAVRNGADYIDGLKSQPRDVWIRGDRVEDVTTHPAFEAPIRQIARLYDMQHDPAYREDLTYVDPANGETTGMSFMMAQNQGDLARRREAYRIWAEATFGLMGRAPDFVNTTLMAWAETPDIFAELGSEYRDNVLRYFEHVRQNDLFLTHSLITPQTDRSKTSAEQADKFLHLGVVKETDAGIVLRGARMLVTLGPIVDDVLVFNLPGLKAGDEAYAMSCAIPVTAPGVRLICREPFEEGGRSAFDHPLATNFEEPDAMMVCDDVLVPWERVFLYGNIELANALYVKTSMRNHTAHQTAVRGVAKLEFAVGLVMAVARMVRSDGFLHVQEKLGEAIGSLELAKGCIARAEMEHEPTAVGTVRASLTPLQTLRGYLPRAYPRVIESLQTLAAGGLLMTPSAADFDSEIGDDVKRFFKGADGVESEERVKLFKLAWDLAGDAFGSRQLQYERYWAGDPVRLLASNYLSYEHKDRCLDTVDRALELAGKPG
jgi:anthranilate 3-monooxygenase (FAD)/4-hydroxyphenylacetate 3-monooxygenase